MIKVFIIGMLLYAAYKIYVPKGLTGSVNEKLEENDDEYTDYEEID